jgi:hypothetical protein
VTSFCRFVTNYCSLATEITIEKHNSAQFWEIMLTLFSLRQLRYLKVSISKRAFGPADCIPLASFPKPQWPNLIYFNLNAAFAVDVASEEWERMMEVRTK